MGNTISGNFSTRIATISDGRQHHSSSSYVNMLRNIGKTIIKLTPHNQYNRIPECHQMAARGQLGRPLSRKVTPKIGVELMEESKIDGHKPFSLDDAVRYRDGLMIALLAHVPLRHKNFAALEIGRDVIKEDGKWSIVIPPEETKTRTYIDFQVPEDLQHQFSTYLTHVRPRMLRRPGCKALWVSAKGGALSYSAVGPVLTRNTTKRLGIRIAPHDARDAAATTWAIAAPEQIGVARDLLAHSDLRTTIKHYNRARGIEASRAHAQVIAAMRKRGRRSS